MALLIGAVQSLAAAQSPQGATAPVAVVLIVQMGLSLNQRGLFANVIRDPKTGLKTADGIRLPLNTEEAIFERLGVRDC